MRDFSFTHDETPTTPYTAAWASNHSGTVEPLRTVGPQVETPVKLEDILYVFAPVRYSERSKREWVDRMCIRPTTSEALEALRERAITMDCDRFTANNPCVRVERFMLVRG